jgi:hypothetical protein
LIYPGRDIALVQSHCPVWQPLPFLPLSLGWDLLKNLERPGSQNLSNTDQGTKEGLNKPCWWCSSKAGPLEDLHLKVIQVTSNYNPFHRANGLLLVTSVVPGNLPSETQLYQKWPPHTQGLLLGKCPRGRGDWGTWAYPQEEIPKDAFLEMCERCKWSLYGVNYKDSLQDSNGGIYFRA